MIKIFGDLHYTGKERIDNRINELLAKNIKEEDNLIFLGDIFDDYLLSFKDNLFYSFVKSIKNNIFILNGNHDFGKGISYKIINHFSERFKVIDKLQNIVIENKNFIFQPYIRYEKNIKYDDIYNLIDNSRKNILLSHTDFSTFKVEETKFDYLINGHIHLFFREKNKINLGAVREVSLGEKGEKKFIEIDKEGNIKINDLDNIINIIKYNIENIDEIKLDKESLNILNIYINNENEEDVKKEIEEKYKGFDIIINVRKKNIEVNELIKGVEENDNDLNYEKVFDDYYDKFINEYKFFKMSKEEAKKMFNDFFLNELNRSGGKIDIKFKKLKLKNFRLFKDLEFNFEKYNGINFITGYNLDESKGDDDDDISSNESGKSTINLAILYLFNSIEKINPISYGEREGNINLELEINKDLIVFNKRFIKKKEKIEYEIDIRINGEDFFKDETNSNKYDLFFNRYKINNIISFIILNNSNFIEVLFSNKNVEKRKILQNIFFVFEIIDNVLNKIKEENNLKENEFKSVKNNFDNINNKRIEFVNNVKERFFKLRKEREEIFRSIEEKSSKKIEIDFEIEDIKNLKKYYDLYGVEKIRMYKLVNEEYFINLEKNKEIEIKMKSLQSELDSIMRQTEGVKKINYDYIIEDVIKEKEIYKKLKNVNENDIKKVKELSINERISEEYFKLGGEISKINIEYDLCKKKWVESKENLNKLEKSKFSKKCEYCGNDLNNFVIIDEKIEEIKKEMAEIESKGKEYKKILDDLGIKYKDCEEKYEIYKRVKDVLNDIDYKFRYNEEDIDNIIEYDKKKTLFELLNTKNNDLEKYKKEKKEINIIEGLNVNEYNILKDVKIIENFNVKEKIVEEYENNLKEIKELKVRLEYVNKYINDIEDDVIKFNKNNNLRRIKRELKEKENEFNRINDFYYILRGKNNLTIDKYIINIIMIKIKELYNNYLTYLFNREIKFNDDFSFNENGNEVEFSNFSSGCKTKLVIGLLMTIISIYKSLGIQTNVLVIDEVFDKSVDSVNFRRMYDMLKVYNNINKDKIFIVSHKSNNVSVDEINEIIVERKNNISRII